MPDDNKNEMTKRAHHDPARTMFEVMSEIGRHDTVAEPSGETQFPDVAKAHLITVPKHRTVVDLTEHHRNAMEFVKPYRRRGVAQLYDLQSLIDWTNRFKGDTSALWADTDMKSPSLTCIADYHASGPIEVDDDFSDPTARHCAHRGVYNFPLSDEWKAWMRISGEMLDKNKMGDFIEERARDIMDPTPAILANKEGAKNAEWENRLIRTAAKIEGRYGQLTELLAMSRSFQVYETSNLSVSTNRDTGEQEIQFLNEHKAKDGKPLKVPNLIIIAIPVFVNGAPYRMPVRFRYRKSGPDVKFSLSIYNPEKAFEAAFNEATQKAAEETDLPIFAGKPEA